jgi:hypothetical protein
LMQIGTNHRIACHFPEEWNDIGIE